MQQILILLAIALGTGKTIGAICDRAKLPPVVGEILAGLLLANLPLLIPGFTLGKELASSTFLRELAQIGIILMLFTVGLESSFNHAARVGPRAVAVAVVGVFLPFLFTLAAHALGILDARSPAAGAWRGEPHFAVAVFIGATLTATSVRMAERVVTGVGHHSSRVGRAILNAAVLDDILGLLVLAGVMLYLGAGSHSWVEALAFFAIAVPVGYFAFPAILRKYWHRDGPSRRSIMAFGLCVCFVYAWFGTLFGLVPIVGAFFAGLLLEDPSDHMGKLIEPIVEFLAPLFFVLIGAQVRLDALAGMGWRGLGQIALLLVLAVAGKVACGAAAAGTARERLAVGVGMIPRGEVGLVFVVAGRQAGVVSDELFGVLVFVILISTILPGLAFHRIMGRVARARA